MFHLGFPVVGYRRIGHHPLFNQASIAFEPIGPRITEGYLLTPQAVGISGTVKPFMVAPDNLFFRVPETQSFDNTGTDGRMGRGMIEPPFVRVFGLFEREYRG